jgi:redox-sensitive bicupin YhaK (pirin superfamily)
MEHEDSAGHRGALGPGDVQWMTAGAGIVHSEMPSTRIQEQGGRVHGFQVWVNLPARLKMTRPRYQEIPSAKIPEGRSGDGLARVKVVAGEALGARAVIDTHTPIIYQDWSVDNGADVTIPVSAEQNALVYVFSGAVRVDDKQIVEGEMALLGSGDAVRLRGTERSARLLLLAGVPVGEPVARYGPFVMNNEAELVQAVRDFQSGRMGEITRSATVG